MNTMVYVANSVWGGIGAFVLDRENDTLHEIAGYLPGEAVAPLALSPDRRFLYAGVRGDENRVAAFAVDAVTGGLHFLNDVPVPGRPTFMKVDGGGRFLLLASYSGGFVAVLTLGREGMLQPETLESARPGRNPHCVMLDASNRFAYVPLLGSDRIAQYRFDAATGTLTPNDPPFVATPRHAGPRHLALRPDNRYAYLLTEMSGEILAYAVNRNTGALTPAHGVPMLPPERALPPGRRRAPGGGGDAPNPVTWAADIHPTPDGRFLYASERTGSTLSRFGVDAVDGTLEFLDAMTTEEQPWGFAVDPRGHYLLVAGAASDHLSLYRLNAGDGALSLCARYSTGKTPIGVAIATYP